MSFLIFYIQQHVCRFVDAVQRKLNVVQQQCYNQIRELLVWRSYVAEQGNIPNLYVAHHYTKLIEQLTCVKVNKTSMVGQ